MSRQKFLSLLNIENVGGIKMNLKKLIPWNWFKHENSIQNRDSVVPVRREDYTQQTDSRNPMLQFHQEVDRLFDDAFNRFGFPSWSKMLGKQQSLGRKKFPAIKCSNNSISTTTQYLSRHRGLYDHLRSGGS